MVDTADVVGVNIPVYIGIEKAPSYTFVIIGAITMKLAHLGHEVSFVEPITSRRSLRRTFGRNGFQHHALRQSQLLKGVMPLARLYRHPAQNGELVHGRFPTKPTVA